MTTIAALAGAALVGIGIGVGPRVLGSDAGARIFDTQHSVRTLTLPGRGTDLSAAEVARRFRNSYAPTGPAAPDARTAVERFLAAEITRNDARSYAQLSAGDRVTYPTVQTWIDRQADSPQLIGATITAVTQSRDAADVRVQLRQRASLDEIQGLVASRAHALYHAVRQEGGWRVALTQSRIANDYLSDRSAGAAAIAWVRDRTRCSTTSAWQWRSGLYGDGGDLTARRLCGAHRAVRVGGPRPLDDGDQTAPLLAAFGPEVELWARVVPLHAPITTNLVLAPVGDRWLVVGVLGSSPEGGQG